MAGGEREAMSLEAIQTAIPHREPFLLVDEIVEQ
jgi:3-hydroxymyristoyl/3-hydroxydecanoyl-(acyl carrier protein) dehydratase